MPRKRNPMRKIKEILRLANQGNLSERQISLGANVTKTTVHDYLLRSKEAGLTWERAQHMDEQTLEAVLFPPCASTKARSPLPDWKHIHKEFHRPHVTLRLLWEEYIQDTPNGLRYSRFCELYGNFAKTLELSMQQVHKAGEKLFIDYSGTTIPVHDGKTGHIRYAEVFIAVLGASSYTYCRASWTQQIPDWINAHVRAFAFFGGVPELLVPDNLRTGVKDPTHYEPVLNPTYQRFAEYYDVAVVPARIRHPKDKAKVEVAVQIVERWIIARLRNHKFFSLEQLNEAIAELVELLNRRPSKHLGDTRLALFEQLDKPVLRPLPDRPYELDDWKDATVATNYHVSYEDNYYSVPYEFVKKTVSVRATYQLIEVLYQDGIIAVHNRLYGKKQYSTQTEHMPANHRYYKDWTIERMLAWGMQTGENVGKLFKEIAASRKHPSQAVNSCKGITQLEGKFGKERLDEACRRALHLRGYSWRCVKNILENGQDKVPFTTDEIEFTVHHENVRGPEYYRQNTEEGNHAATSSR
jgi:transposase